MDWQEITSQPKGTDVHGLLERVAYRFYSKNRYCTENPEENWVLAQSSVSIAEQYWPHIFESLEKFHRALEWTADTIRKRENVGQDTAWYMAQDYWADELINLNRRIRMAA